MSDLVRRVKIWRAANGPGWITHLVLRTEEFGWIGVGQMWSTEWQVALRRGLMWLEEHRDEEK